MSSDEAAARKKAISDYVESGDVFRFDTLRLFVDQPRCGEEIVSFFEANGSVGILGTLPGGAAPSAVYPHLRQLISEGYLELRMSGRSRIYSLTDQGREFLTRVPQGKFEATFQAMMETWEERNRLDESLAELADAIHVWVHKRRDGTPLFKVLAEATAAVRSLS